MTDMRNGDAPLLYVDNIRKRFGRLEVVSNLQFSVAAGEFFALLGPNGAGKTTTLRVISGLTHPDAGDARIVGHSIRHEPEAAKQHLAYLPDEPLVYDALTPLEYLEFVAGLWGVEPAQAVSHARVLLERLELWDRRRERTAKFSRGLKQRLALAGALIHQPRVLLLDEPLTGVDPAGAKIIRELLLEFVRDGNAIVLTTHQLETVERLANRIGVIAHGRLITHGTAEALRAAAGLAGGTLEDVYLALIGGVS